MDKIKRQFEKFEIENNLNTLKINGYPAWEIIRFFVFQDILIQKGITKQAIYPRKKIFFYVFKNIFHIIKNICRLFSLFSFKKQYDVFFLGHPRRQKQEDGLYYDIYTDYIKKEFKNKGISYISFEETYFNFYSPISKSSKPLYKLDFIYILFLIKVKIFRFENNEYKKIKKIEEKLNNIFGVQIDLENRIKRDILLFGLLVKFYNKILKLLGIKKIIEVVGFSIWAKALNYSAKKIGIKTYELQHGAIIDNLSCSLTNGFTGNTLPNFVFTYGKFWNNIIRFPKKQKIISLGFPYFENLLNKNMLSNNKSKFKDNILIISQGNVSEKLSGFTRELALKYKDYNFLYKLHPGEFSNDSIIKKNLYGLKNIKLIYDNYNIYDLFQKVDICIGVSSTSLYEGFLFRKKIYIVALDDSYKSYNFFLEKKYFNLINLNKIEINFKKENENINYDYFLEKGALKNILNLIKM